MMRAIRTLLVIAALALAFWAFGAALLYVVLPFLNGFF
jgi:hypothetical protein